MLDSINYSKHVFDKKKANKLFVLTLDTGFV